MIIKFVFTSIFFVSILSQPLNATKETKKMVLAKSQVLKLEQEKRDSKNERIAKTAKIKKTLVIIGTLAAGTAGLFLIKRRKQKSNIESRLLNPESSSLIIPAPEPQITVSPVMAKEESKDSNINEATADDQAKETDSVRIETDCASSSRSCSSEAERTPLDKCESINSHSEAGSEIGEPEVEASNKPGLSELAKKHGLKALAATTAVVGLGTAAYLATQEESEISTALAPYDSQAKITAGKIALAKIAAILTAIFSSDLILTYVMVKEELKNSNIHEQEVALSKIIQFFTEDSVEAALTNPSSETKNSGLVQLAKKHGLRALAATTALVGLGTAAYLATQEESGISNALIPYDSQAKIAATLAAAVSSYLANLSSLVFWNPVCMQNKLGFLCQDETGAIKKVPRFKNYCTDLTGLSELGRICFDPTGEIFCAEYWCPDQHGIIRKKKNYRTSCNKL